MPAITSYRQRVEDLIETSKPAQITEGRPRKVARRSGFAAGIPYGGADDMHRATGTNIGQKDRETYLSELHDAYIACPWSSACVDVIARTCTAGGVDVTPKIDVYSAVEQPSAPDQVKEIQDLLRFINPNDDPRQFFRRIITQLLVYGDSYTEVVWVMGKPAMLYPLDPRMMTVQADKNGNVKGYTQTNEHGDKTTFKPNEVIHVKLDSPGDEVYGVSPTMKNNVPITAWLFTSALLTEAMRRGDPSRLHVDWPLALPDTERQRLTAQYAIRNLGLKNIGNLFETKGGAIVKELGVNRINDWLNTRDQLRNEILSGYGVPPSKVAVIESGNLGGGTGTSQDKYFRVNTCGPLQEIVLEKFSFALLYQTYGITDWVLKFGVVDWRDDQVIEAIRDMRIRNGSWTLNRARADIGEPPVEGGDAAVLVDRQNMVLWSDLEALSNANVAVTQAAVEATKAQTAAAKAQTTNAPVPGKTDPSDKGKGPGAGASSTSTPGKAAKNTVEAPGSTGQSAAPKATSESISEALDLWNSRRVA